MTACSTFSRRSLAFLPRILRGTWLLTGNVAASLSTSNMHATSVNDDTLANRPARRGATRRTVPILALSLALPRSSKPGISPRGGEAHRCKSVVVRCSAAQPGLGSVQQLPTLGSRVCEYLLLPFSLALPPPSEPLFLCSSPSRGPSAASLSFSLSRTCEPTAT